MCSLRYFQYKLLSQLCGTVDQLKPKKNKSTLSHFWCLKLLVVLCLYSVNVSVAVCSMCVSFVLSLGVQSFHKLNKLELSVSLLLFYCSVYRLLVSILSWPLMLALDSFRYLLPAISDEWLMCLHNKK